MRTRRGFFISFRLIMGALTIAAISVATSGAAAAAGLSTAYQGAVTTTVSITSTPSATQGQCVTIRIAVTSDAGTPSGSVTFAVDTILHSAALPASGMLLEVIGCSSAPFSRALAVGPHTLAATFVPSGNWAPSHASGRLTILAAGATPVGLPTGVDAGLANVPTPTSHRHDDGRIVISGLAILAAAGVIAGYQRRRGHS